MVCSPETVPFQGSRPPELLEAFSDKRDEALFTAALGLGLRFGEVLGLRWQDVNFDPSGGGTVSVRFQLQRVESKLQLTLPKSDSSQRALALPLFVGEALQRRREAQDQEQLLSGDRWDNSLGLVFTNRDGGPLDPSRVRKRFKKVMEDCPQSKLRLHDLRHIAASILLGGGISPTDTASQLGHADPFLVMRTYGHAMPQGKREAASAMDKAFAKRRAAPLPSG